MYKLYFKYYTAQFCFVMDKCLRMWIGAKMRQNSEHQRGIQSTGNRYVKVTNFSEYKTITCRPCENYHLASSLTAITNKPLEP
jgi:hypothetical protein